MKIEQIEDPTELVVIHRELILPTFIPDELEPVESLLSGVKRGDTVVMAIRDGERVIAVTIGNWFADAQSMLLAYLAVRPEARSRGIGGPLLRDTMAYWAERFSPRMVVAEVEHPAFHLPDPVRGDPTARLRFYARTGGRVLDLPYFQPRLTPDGNPVFGMLLLALAVDPGLLSDDGARMADISYLRTLLGSYSREFQRPPVDDSPQIEAFLDAMDAEGGIRLLSFADYDQVVFAGPA